MLLKQGLIKVVKEYVRSNPKLCKYYHKRMEKVKEGICGLQRSEQNEDIETPSLNTNVVKKESPEG